MTTLLGAAKMIVGLLGLLGGAAVGLFGGLMCGELSGFVLALALFASGAWLMSRANNEMNQL